MRCKFVGGSLVRGPYDSGWQGSSVGEVSTKALAEVLTEGL